MEDSQSFGKTMKEKILKRKRVNKALEIFRDLSHKLYCEYKSSEVKNLKAKTKALLEAAMFMKEKHQWENSGKRLGHVDGIEVGDHFQYRNELVVIGLHQQFCSGIDYLGKGEFSFATSIVVSDKYANVMKSGGCLVYEGQGSNPNVKTTAAPPRDQKLEGGNLALRNSMNGRRPVRVILKVFGKFNGREEWKNTVSDYSYVYDGLYLVDRMTQERGQFGKLVFKFVLNKISDQSAGVSSRDVVKNQPASVSSRDVVKETETFLKRRRTKGCGLDKDVIRINDISEGKEKFPIRVVTPISCVEKPKPFGYLVKMSYPKMNHSTLLGGGCNCENACVDSLDCVCIAKNNGGTLAYGGNKRLVSPIKPSFIYECGPSCACSSTCMNRVSQCGIQFQLEIFKTNSKGWGVRTRSFIPSGSFVCELIGELVHQNNGKSGSNLHVDDYIFNIGGGFIDATRHGNIGRFINHSCCPNLCMKDVMYDHNDKSLPHKMLFALKDIAPGREVSYDYNCCKGSIKGWSNICCCGSSECKGYIYN
ncbi:histone-lysine N-methyltransferase, H3 lysine-9 specific SUVH5-like [Vicia villosa]|uniref:histone-lysine N-methyltransferase, H3 lysine-9 specific SUVH5-like n=1 Tax=Vicia villosa TaxID=3911 RepID=UPI00273CD39A|nr:histone-lysine N-methyltransferase, H3 lysine-9 specific SUVH5-like [Vicia villosa]